MLSHSTCTAAVVEAVTMMIAAAVVSRGHNVLRATHHTGATPIATVIHRKIHRIVGKGTQTENEKARAQVLSMVLSPAVRCNTGKRAREEGACEIVQG